jgi:hypothetical protein
MSFSGKLNNNSNSNQHQQGNVVPISMMTMTSMESETLSLPHNVLSRPITEEQKLILVEELIHCRTRLLVQSKVFWFFYNVGWGGVGWGGVGWGR